MTWTYGGTPGNSTAAERRDAVRLAVGDTDTTDQGVTDEEIAYWLSESGNDTYGAAAQAAHALAAKYARLVDTAHESLRTSYSQRQQAYMALAVRLEAERSKRGGLGVPVLGGISIGEMESVDDNTDRVPPRFHRGQFDNPANGSILRKEYYDGE